MSRTRNRVLIALVWAITSGAIWFGSPSAELSAADDDASAAYDAIHAAGLAASEAAAAALADDRGAFVGATDRARTAVADARRGLADAAIQPGERDRAAARLTRFESRLERAAGRTESETHERRRIVRDLRKALRSATDAARALQMHAVGPRAASPSGKPLSLRRKALTARVRVDAGRHPDGSACDEIPTVTSTPLAGPGVVTVTATRTRGSTWRLRTAGGPGAALVTFTACGTSRSIVVADLGTRADLDGPFTAPPGPTSVAYAGHPPAARVGEAFQLDPPIVGGGPASSFALSPPLPAGLTFVTSTGAISGTALTEMRRTEYTISALSDTGNAFGTVTLAITPELPPEVVELEPTFAIEPVLTGLNVPVKMAATPDGRVLYTELTSGDVRVVAADGTLLATPFASEAIVGGGERGLLGIAVAPTFATTGHVFVFACVGASDGKPDRNQVVRYTAVGDVGTDRTIIVDDIPQSILHNAGDLTFGPDGMLYVTAGDAEDPDLAQTDGSLAGRVLRFTPAGLVPNDNPTPGDPEWARGFRNPFDATFHPTAGTLYVSENGPTANDELNVVFPGKNFEWGPVPPDLPGFRIGIKMIDWTPVIVPTGVTFVSAETFGDEYANSLFVGGYDEADIRTLELSGQLLSDLDSEDPFARFDSSEIAHRPLDLIEGPDGTLWVSTFTGIWRIERW